jgi:hypothetical protein
MYFLISNHYFMEQMNVPDDQKLPVDYDSPELPNSVSIFRPLVFQDGDSVCVVLGPDPQGGVFGRGATDEEALNDWDNHLQDLIKYHKEDDELAQYILDTLKASVKKVG